LPAPSKKYESVSFANITGMVWQLTGEVGLTDFIRRLTFTILTGNGDMHLKNWSFIYKDGHSLFHQVKTKMRASL